MPVRSLNLPVLKWPDRNRVHKAAQAWACEQVARHPELCQMGYLGSYARGDWGVGSDLNLVAVVAQAILPFEARARARNIEDLPMPAELLVYAEQEW